MSNKISDEQLGRHAVVYIRQSTPAQVTTNLESQRRQYALVERAKELGFRDVDVIDDDLGRSGSGLSERPGFQRLVAQVCAGQVGAVFCIEASRLARNGRDWHHLVDFCGLVGAVIVDPEGIYDPRLANDRLLLGLKGTMSEFELSLFRQRSLEALRAKARRGELQFCLPVGLCWTEDGRIDLDPDRRVQESIRLVFRKFRELGSVRQVLLWMREQKVQLPARTYGSPMRAAVWKLPVYNTVHSVISNPFYAGAYAFGRTGARTRIVGDRARRTDGHVKPIEQWMVLIHDHHPGYISWQKFQNNQQTLADNAHMKKRMAPKAGRGGRALLSGLLRCRRCGRMLHVTYVGLGGRGVRYSCRGAHVNHGQATCISFGGLRADETIARAIVEAVSPHAVQAALEAAERTARMHTDQQRAVTLELEQARYQGRLAARRYETVDPDNRLVASELEARWNAALARVHELEARLSELSLGEPASPHIDRSSLLALADCLPTVWNSPAADMRLKQRIVRLLVREVIADVDQARSEIVLTVHWHGGQHTEYRATKNKTGQHRHATSEQAVDIVRRMAGRWPDEQIAATLNRIGLHTGSGNTWNEMRVYTLRHRLQLPAYDAALRAAQQTLTLGEAARELGVSETVVRKLIQRGQLQAAQVARCAPYEIDAELLKSESLQRAVRAARRLGRGTRQHADDRRALALPGLDQPLGHRPN
jgi:DNA invertase Pin-like site-specific DNA recombinase